MKKLVNYLETLSFQYVISYEGLRGESLRKLILEQEKEIKTLEQGLKSLRFMDQNKQKKQIASLKANLNTPNLRVINQDGTLHPTARAVHRFEKEDDTTEQLMTILRRKFTEQMYWVCAPIFREVLVFYDKKDAIQGMLHICLSCEWMKNELGDDIEVDYQIFAKLKTLLQSLGHQIDIE